jgi:ABC-type bacteriocin/lantibiotic exporter with double-glycine peptidase domain
MKIITSTLAILFLIGFIWLLWTFKWIFLSACVIYSVFEMLFENYTGRNTRFYKMIDKQKEE